ncbi:ABC transporter ATP-binding protein [Dubosiella muris]|uniref:ABC transporter ATP-binding protein n=1 Tax=Dubosiella muris TaxID=3038133 RepID=A0AC61R647_9FIRM|nr:ABC transporter ATP-binding protein [Dubosiella muris]TGY65405.1 ABC transporter ATP-binding protein [Dubosiella muris]
MPKKLTFKQCLVHLWGFLKDHRVKLLTGLFLVLVMQVIYAVMPSIEGMITTQLQLDVTQMAKGVPGAHIQMNVIVRILLMLLGVYLIKITSQLVSAFLLTDSIQKTMEDIRDAIEKKINRLPVSYFDAQETGDLLSRITNDVETVSNALQQTLSRVIGAVCTFVFVSIMMCTINLVMTLMVYVALPVIAMISFGFVKKSQPLFDTQQQSLADLNATINELYSGFNEIVIYDQQEKAKDRFQKANEAMRESGFKALFLSGLIGPTTSLVTYVTIGCVALYGCLQVLAGVITLGQLQAFIRYIWNINDPIAQLSQLSNQVQSAFSAMNRLFTFLDMDEVMDTQGEPFHEPIRTIDFERVRFGYGQEPLMRDVNIHVEAGQTIAIVGPTGAGKTTLTNLLLRFYEIGGGAIKINGRDIRTMSYHDLRDLFGLVLQDAWLFEDTIEQNLKYGRHEALRCEVVEGAKQANVHHYIRTLSNGYDSLINESGSNISQGEKQLLTIARALIKDPKILILDEATSSVDTRLEKRLQSAMDVVMRNRTSFVIAHRLSTIVNADLILVMQHGDIVESGTHEALLEKGGEYAKLYNAQFAQE